MNELLSENKKACKYYIQASSGTQPDQRLPYITMDAFSITWK